MPTSKKLLSQAYGGAMGRITAVLDRAEVIEGVPFFSLYELHDALYAGTDAETCIKLSKSGDTKMLLNGGFQYAGYRILVPVKDNLWIYIKDPEAQYNRKAPQIWPSFNTNKIGMDVMSRTGFFRTELYAKLVPWAEKRLKVQNLTEAVRTTLTSLEKKVNSLSELVALWPDIRPHLKKEYSDVRPRLYPLKISNELMSSEGRLLAADLRHGVISNAQWHKLFSLEEHLAPEYRPSKHRVLLEFFSRQAFIVDSVTSDRIAEPDMVLSEQIHMGEARAGSSPSRLFA